MRVLNSYYNSSIPDVLFGLLEQGNEITLCDFKYLSRPCYVETKITLRVLLGPLRTGGLRRPETNFAGWYLAGYVYSKVKGRAQAPSYSMQCHLDGTPTSVPKTKKPLTLLQAVFCYLRSN